MNVERSGRPHLRSEDTTDLTTVVIPIELTIYRAHFLELSETFESNQSSIAEQLQLWYNEWNKPNMPVVKVVGANDLSGKRGGKRL